jgi:hypothetical protein
MQRLGVPHCRIMTSETRRERRAVPFAKLLSALPDVALSATFLLTWIQPAWLGLDRIQFLLSVMLLEFIIIHSSVFMGQVLLSKSSGRAKLTALVGFGLFYSLFAGGFSLALKSWWPITAFWGLTLNKFLFVIMRTVPGDEEKWTWQSNWGLHAMFYLGGVFATTFLPLPRLGITGQVLSEIHLPGGGLWIEQPWRVLAFGFVYFGAVALTEITGYRLPQKTLPPTERPSAR